MKRETVVIAILMMTCGIAAAALITHKVSTSHGDQGMSTPIPPARLTNPGP